MRILMTGLAVIALAACNQQPTDPDVAKVDEPEIGAAAEVSNPPYGDTAFEYTAADGTISTLSHDNSGAYMITGAGELRDRGSYDYVDGKLCYDSEMLDEDPGCFASPAEPIEIGQTYKTDDGKGAMTAMKRVPYQQPAREAPE